MKGTMKRALAFALLLACLALCGCAAQPPRALVRAVPEGQRLVSADTEGLAPAALKAALYFRYSQTGYLAPEERLIAVPRDESPEKALVQALLDGPAPGTGQLTGLFPPGTELLSALREGNTVVVTFSEGFLGRYSDEPGELNAGPWRTEGPLRRQLCLDALAATLTEAGLCSQVQVMVYRGLDRASPMRLQAGFLDRSKADAVLPPLTRNEETLLTAHNTAQLLLRAWQSQDWAALYDLTARSGASPRPGEQSAVEAFSAASALIGYALSPGSVALDGQTAVLCADLTLRGDHADRLIRRYPLRLIREGGLWKMAYDPLLNMLNQD